MAAVGAEVSTPSLMKVDAFKKRADIKKRSNAKKKSKRAVLESADASADEKAAAQKAAAEKAAAKEAKAKEAAAKKEEDVKAKAEVCIEE